MSTANIIGNAIFGLRNKSGGNYIDPAVKESLVGLWKFDQNTNESPTRNIIKNTIKDKGGDLELLNFAYKANSGYNGYVTDFTEWKSNNTNKTQTKITVSRDIDYPVYLASFENATSAPSFRIKVSRLPKGQNLYYKYINEEGLLEGRFDIPSDGIYTLPATAVSDTPTMVATLANEQYGINIKGLTIEQLPLHEGALVTDGKDDMIVSQKTVQEMLGGSKEITVVSMIHQIGRVATNTNLFTNCIQANTGSKGCNIVNYQTSLGKTGIYGYSRANVSVANNEVVINNILGDKADYLTNVSIGALTSNEKFSVVGYLDVSPQQVTSVAVYWNFIANKVLTTDEINQIIAYYNLDKYVEPTVVYDVKKQGLTNDTPAADWYLKDFSGNGYDMQLYNYAKSKNSGIGKYELDFNEFATNTHINAVLIEKNKDTFYAETLVNSSTFLIYKTIQANNTLTDTPSFKAKVEINKGTTLQYRYINSDGVQSFFNITEEGEHEFPISYNNRYVNSAGVATNGFVLDGKNTCRITQIPDYEDALVSDGKDDYGKAERLPIFKDYTVVADRALIGDGQGAFMTKSSEIQMGAFGLEIATGEQMSFGNSLHTSIVNKDRSITYMSTYSYNGQPNTKGTREDDSYLCLATIKPGDSRFSSVALWSLLLFPYSLSEFLLERQLKRYKLGTLYPDMVEFRPVISRNIPYNAIEISQGSTTLYNKSINKTGIYLQEGSTVRVYIQPSGIDEVSKITVNGVEYTDLPINPNGFYYADFPIAKSPQKISYAIDEYIRYEDIVQPYPAIINLKQDGKTITWGDKLKVGSDIVFVGSANLLPELYTVSETQYNGVTLYPNTILKVEKSMVFDNARTYLKANEPSCILSPNRLRIPNSSYKILGYIPDLTGKGNHGRLNNFAYVGMSGANGYVEDFTKWSKNSSLDDIEITYDRIKVNKLTGSTVLYVTSNKFINKIKIVASGIPNGGKLTFTQYPDNAIENNKEFEIGGVTTTGSWGFSIKEGLNLDWSNLVIQQIGEHEGSICFDGTDDHITIPTLAHGGKCVMMKVNWSNESGTIYDQRVTDSGEFAIFLSENNLDNEIVPAYGSRNNGNTYIDGILNTSILTSQLKSITHNITIANDKVALENTTSPFIGCKSAAIGFFANMSLYEFMLFPEIPSEDEIKKLNDVMGIEGGYVESPNYYWDAYGKKNTDTDRNLIADQVSKDVTNALEVKNVGYNSESGYNGYIELLFNKWSVFINENRAEIDKTDTTLNITKVYIQNKAIIYCGIGHYLADIPSKYKITGVDDTHPIKFGNDGFPNEPILTVTKDGEYEVDWYNYGKNPCIMAGFIGDCNITIEQVAQYPNGLLLDGVEDHAINTVIPAVTDFTVIAKREWLGDYQPSAAFVTKGTSNTYTKAAFMMEYKSSASIQIGSFGILNSGQNMPDLITYMTPIDYNKAGLSKGTAIDENGLIMGKYSNTHYWKGVFYKLMFYTKTIDQLSINMLKNLFERDELIDVTNPIFKKQ